MKQAILTKYLGPTNHRGARIKAWCSGGQLIMPWDHSLSVESNHAAAGQALVKKRGWHYQYSMAPLPDGTGYCFVQVEREES